jgi:hypothetical protein
MERTTVRLNEGLLEESKHEAARLGQTLTAFIEDSLRFRIKELKNPKPRRRVKIPVSKARGGPYPGIDINNSASLLAIMEEKG